MLSIAGLHPFQTLINKFNQSGGAFMPQKRLDAFLSDQPMQISLGLLFKSSGCHRNEPVSCIKPDVLNEPSRTQ